MEIRNSEIGPAVFLQIKRSTEGNLPKIYLAQGELLKQHNSIPGRGGGGTIRKKGFMLMKNLKISDFHAEL